MYTTAVKHDDSTGDFGQVLSFSLCPLCNKIVHPYRQLQQLHQPWKMDTYFLQCHVVRVHLGHLPVHLEMLQAILLCMGCTNNPQTSAWILGGHEPSYIQHRLPLHDFLSFFLILLVLLLSEMALGTAQNEEVQQFSSFVSVSYHILTQ